MTSQTSLIVKKFLRYGVNIDFADRLNKYMAMLKIFDVI